MIFIDLVNVNLGKIIVCLHVCVKQEMGWNPCALFSQEFSGISVWKNDLIVGLELIFVTILHN